MWFLRHFLGFLTHFVRCHFLDKRGESPSAVTAFFPAGYGVDGPVFWNLR